MTYRVTLAPAAARQLRKSDAQGRRRIQAALELLATQPRPPAATQLLGGAGEWRVRTGDYRIIYEIHDDVPVVLVLRIGHRRDVHHRRSAIPIDASADRTPPPSRDDPIIPAAWPR